MGVGFLPSDGSMGGWAPGWVPKHLPEGVGYYLPKGSDLVIQVHYHRTGKVEKDRLKVGLYFAKKPVQRRFSAAVITGWFTRIPAGAANYRVQGWTYAHEDVTLYSIMPHMHLLGKEITVTMTRPDGTTRQLIAIKEWDYNWQETYFFQEPIEVPAGTRFDVVAVYDNSDQNPRNPHRPPRAVRFGEQTTDEMCFVFLGAAAADPKADPAKVRRLRFGPFPPLSTEPGEGKP